MDDISLRPTQLNSRELPVRTVATRSHQCSTLTGWATRSSSRWARAPPPYSCRLALQNLLSCRQPWSMSSPPYSSRCPPATPHWQSRCPQDAFASVRQAVSAGEALPAEILERYREHFGLEILDGIGSTEMGHIYISNRTGEAVGGSSGFVVPGHRIKLLDDEETEVPVDTPGKLGLAVPQPQPGIGAERTPPGEHSWASGFAPATSTNARKTNVTPIWGARMSCLRCPASGFTLRDRIRVDRAWRCL